MHYSNRLSIRRHRQGGLRGPDRHVPARVQDPRQELPAARQGAERQAHRRELRRRGGRRGRQAHGATPIGHLRVVPRRYRNTRRQTR